MSALRWRLAIAVALSLVVAGLVGFVAWQYVMPADARAVFGLNPQGVARFRAAYGVAPAPVTPATFSTGLQVSLGAIWVSYLLFVGLGAAGAPLSPRLSGAAAIGAVLTVLAVAVLCPPSLSVDAYAYAGYGRMAVVHGLNPHVVSKARLVGLGDETAPFLFGDFASPYGPLWTALSIGVVGALRGAGLFAQVLAMKLIAAGALLGMAAAGAALGARSAAPERRPFVFCAIALNPLLVIEGAGNGHNDLAMMALVLAALVALASRRHHLAALCVGCAAAIKFVPLLLLPWIGAAAVRHAAPRRALRVAATVGLVGVAPLVLSYLPFWAGLQTFAGLHAQLGDRAGSAATDGPLSLLARLATVGTFVGLSIWVAARPEVERVSQAWVIIAGVLLFSTVRELFPWYIAWPLAPALARWDRRNAAASFAVLGLAAVFSLQYALVPAP